MIETAVELFLIFGLICDARHIDGDNADRSGALAGTEESAGFLSKLTQIQAIVGGKEMDFKYKDCKKEMDMVNKAFIETMIEGDANGRGFQYPIPTYSFTSDFD